MKRNPPFVVTKEMVRTLSTESPHARLLHRLHAVALVEYGLSSSEVGRIFGDSARAVAYWVTRFKQQGLAGLEEESRPGRPTKLTPEQLRKLQIFLNQSRADSMPIKAAELVGYIRKEFNVVLTATQCWRILKRLKT